MTDTLLQRFVKIIKIHIQTSFFIPIAFASQFLKMVALGSAADEYGS